MLQCQNKPMTRQKYYMKNKGRNDIYSYDSYLCFHLKLSILFNSNCGYDSTNAIINVPQVNAQNQN